MKHLLFLISLMFITANAQKIETVRQHSEVMQQDRDIIIYTPRGYDEYPEIKYETVYVFDAQIREYFDFTQSVLSFINTSEKSFIVVGILSPATEEYSRNNDFLTPPAFDEEKVKFTHYAGNANTFMLYLKNEAIPYIEKNYRVAGNRTAIGHSNGAFFILHALSTYPELFNGYIAVSPHFSYNRDELVKELAALNYAAFSDKKFLFISNASEDQSKGWESWKPSRNKAYAFLNNPENLKNKAVITITEYPDENHWSTFAPAVTDGLKAYFNYLEKISNEYSEALYEVTIKVKVPNKDDVVYITGNQPELASWKPDALKMKQTGAFTRELMLKIHNPAQFKITRGSWETEARVEGGGNANLKIDASQSKIYGFVVKNWKDR